MAIRRGTKASAKKAARPKRQPPAKSTASPPSLPSDAASSNSRIEHIVVLMLENRSFYHIFGFRPGVEGVDGSEFNLLDPSKPESATNPAFHVDNGARYAVLAGQGPGCTAR